MMVVVVVVAAVVLVLGRVDRTADVVDDLHRNDFALDGY